MAIFTVNTPFNIDLEFALGKFWKRLLAWLIDLAVIFGYGYIVLFLIYGNADIARNTMSAGNMDKVMVLLMISVLVIPIMLYPLITELLMNGRTVGKLAMGIRVMNKEGASATLSQLLLRWILCLVNYFNIIIIYAVEPSMLFGIIMLLGFLALPDVISILASKHNQRLGDLAANTVIVDTRYKMGIEETIFVDITETTYTPLYPEVLKLTDRDINGIRNLLGTKPNKDTEMYMFKVAYRIEQVLQIKMNGEPIVFLQTLLKDYNYLTQNK